MSDVAIMVDAAVAIAAVIVDDGGRSRPGRLHSWSGSAYLELAVGLGVEGTVKAITAGFGEIMAEVGLLIAFGVLIGAILQQDRRDPATRRDADCGSSAPNGCPIAMSLTIATALQSIFLDVLLVISAPLAAQPREEDRQTARRDGGRRSPSAWSAGYVLTVPGVGALALAGLLGVPLGKMLLFGIFLVIPTSPSAVAIMSFLFDHGWSASPTRDESQFLVTTDIS